MFPNEDTLESKFTLESDKGGVIDEPPFHLLVMGDWSGDGEKRPLSERSPIEIDRDNFDEVMAKFGVRLDLEAKNGSIGLEFRQLDDLHPDEIFRQVPLFDELRDLRQQLKNEDTFYAAARKVREWNGADTGPSPEPAAPATSVAPAGSLLDAILTQPTGGAPAPRGSDDSELNLLISDIIRPHLVLVDEDEQKGMLNAVDTATSSLMRTIIHTKRFRELEAAWRGLFLLVRRIETDSDLKIFILDVSKDELAADLKSSSDLRDTTMYEFLVTKAEEDDEPWSVLLGNYNFSPTLDDVAALIRIGTLAARANASFVSHMRPEVLGIHSLAEQSDPREWRMTADSDAGRLWATLRGIPEAEYIGMTMPRFLSRLPYGRDTEPLESFAFEEFEGPPPIDGYCWANGSFLAGALLAQTFSQHGWDMSRTFKQDLEDLPVHVFEDKGETVNRPAGEVLLTQNACELLMEYGLMPLISYKNTDRLKLGRFQSISDPVTALRGRWR